jgi:hypothetical protein
VTKYYAVATHRVLEVATGRSREVGSRYEWNDGESFLSFNQDVSGVWPLHFERIRNLPKELDLDGLPSRL